MSAAVLFTTAGTWEPPRCPPMNDGEAKCCHPHRGLPFSRKKEGDPDICHMWMNLHDNMLGEIVRHKGQVLCDLTRVRSLKWSKRRQKGGSQGLGVGELVFTGDRVSPWEDGKVLVTAPQCDCAQCHRAGHSEVASRVVQFCVFPHAGHQPPAVQFERVTCLADGCPG